MAALLRPRLAWVRVSPPTVREPSTLATVACAAIVVALLAASPSAGEPRDGSADPAGYTLTAWTAQGDLALGDVLAIAEDREGYLWLGTSGGLVRFDGASFLR